MWNEFKKIDRKFLLACIVGIFLPLTYGILRTYFIVSHGSNSYALSSYWSYIQIFMEITGAFLILPLFTFANKKNGNKNFSILVGVVGALLILIMLLFSLTVPLLNSMVEINTDDSITRNMLRNFLWLSFISNGLLIYEKFLMADVIIERNNKKVYLFTSIALTLKISLDILFLSSISPIEYSVNNIALSQMISTIIIIAFLQIYWFITYYKESSKIKFDKEELIIYYKKGVVPGFEVAVRNFFYAFVTLKIVNSLGELQWNSWHLAGWVYWHIIFQFTIVFEYVLLSERINNKDLDFKKVTRLFLLFDLAIFIIIGPISIIFILPLIVDEEEWLSLTTITAFIMLPFMYFMGTQGLFRTKFLTENKLRLILYNTLITNLVIQLPVFIIMLFGVSINYSANLAIWMSAISMSYFIYVFQYIKYE